MLMHPAPISTDRFTFQRGPINDLFCADISDLANATSSFCPGQVWDDACDLGFTLVSHKTGRELVCAHIDTVTDAEGDLLYLTFAPVDHEQRLTPAESRIRVYLYND